MTNFAAARRLRSSSLGLPRCRVATLGEESTQSGSLIDREEALGHLLCSSFAADSRYNSLECCGALVAICEPIRSALSGTGSQIRSDPERESHCESRLE